MTVIPLVFDWGSDGRRLDSCTSVLRRLATMANKEWCEEIGKSDRVANVAVERAA